MILMLKKITGSFYEKNCKRLIKNNLEQKKILTRKGDKLYVKSKGYDNRFNSWINKKGLV